MATWVALGAILGPSLDAFLKSSVGHLGPSSGDLVISWVLLGSKVTLLRCNHRSRSAPVQSNRVCLNT